MRDDAEMDRWIDSALASYAEADPKLAECIVAFASGEPVAPRRRWLTWAIAAPAVACAILLILLFGPKFKHNPSEQIPPHEALSRPAAEIPRAALTSSHPVHIHRPRVVSVDLPKQEVFPTRQPLTQNERVFAEFAARATGAERKSLLQAQRELDKPIQISAIHIDAIRIPPLKSPLAGSN